MEEDWAKEPFAPSQNSWETALEVDHVQPPLQTVRGVGNSDLEAFWTLHPWLWCWGGDCRLLMGAFLQLLLPLLSLLGRGLRGGMLYGWGV